MLSASLNDATVDNLFPDITILEEQAKLVDTRAALKVQADKELHPAAVALAILRDENISTSEISAAAKDRISARVPQLHTFVPLYTTNHCDSECKMCAMRGSNTALIRKFAGKKALEEQLRILYECEHVRGVGFLTGEYSDEYTRLANAFRIGWAIRTAFDIGFERIYFNIGSMVPDEIEVLGEWIEKDDPVTMCVFQETYDRSSYARFMGDDPRFPKSDYDRRIRSFDHWLDAGFRYVNPGTLVGLHQDTEAEVINLVSHVTHLANRGAVVDVSLPRLRPAQGLKNVSGVDDDKYLRMMATVALVCPEHRLVLTTREDEVFQKKAIDLCGVFSPGSPDVAPYRRDDHARNEIKTSQFIVADLRRPREILAKLEAEGREIDYFAGAAATAAAT
ncbi:MAG TPA: 3-methyl-2-indolic acid synthase [Pyrinomonadaceae bacterium]|jgi:3-methyl-2-indolic acid synthase|nr:3-methyl-2-indolic acid synthase [Pyrinomonadaceae bacterium]